MCFELTSNPHPQVVVVVVVVVVVTVAAAVAVVTLSKSVPLYMDLDHFKHLLKLFIFVNKMTSKRTMYTSTGTSLSHVLCIHPLELLSHILFMFM